MATVLNKYKANAAKIDARLNTELMAATKRLKFADYLQGGLLILVLLLGYTLLSVLLDRVFELPWQVRLLGLVSFLALLGLTIWRFMVRPALLQINPRYTARALDLSSAMQENAVINWVDLKDQALPEYIRAEVGKQAVEELASTDKAKVGESRSLKYLGFVAVALVVGLICFALFVKASPFMSLLQRAYNPLRAGGIAQRTEIRLEEPAGGNVTITSGESLTVRVSLRGSIPVKDSPTAPRLLVRYNLESTDADTFLLEQVDNSAEFALKLTPSTIQNGFTYRIAAGDAQTDEYTVTVRTRPIVRDFQVEYVYPAYTRLKPEQSTEANIEGYRGTQVTLRMRANRSIREAKLAYDQQAVQPKAEIGGANRDELTFNFTLEESGSYRILFQPDTEEPLETSAPFPIRVIQDQRPTITITSPKDEEISLPINGLFAIDAITGDDFGITAIRLRFRLAGAQPTPLMLTKYREGKDFKRAEDGSFPLKLSVKMSQKLSEMKNSKGEAVTLQPGQILEYRFEATDNCTTPGPNLGVTEWRKIKLGEATPKTPENKPNPAEQDRKDEEQKHNAEQDRNQKQEVREPQQPRPDQTGEQGKQGEKGKQESNDKPNPNEKQDNPEKQPGETKPNEGNTEPNKTETAPKPNESKPKEGNKPTEGTKPNETNPNETKPNEGTKPDDKMPQEGTKPTEGTKPSEQPKPKDAATESKERELEKKAEQLKNELNKQDKKDNNQPETKPGEAKPMHGQTGKSDEQTKPDSQGKPSGDGNNTKPQAGEQKPKSDANDTTKPTQKPGASGDNKQPQDKPLDPKEIEQAARDLNSNDPKKQQEARDKLDKAIGKENREQAEAKAKQLQQDLQSDDPKKREAAQKEIEQMQEQMKKAQAEQQKKDAANGKPEQGDTTPPAQTKPNGKPEQSGDKPGEKKEPTPEQIAEAKKTLEDLNSKDDDTRKAAEKKVEDAVGKDAREQMQKDMKDLQSDDPKKQQEAKERLEKQAKQQAEANKDKQPEKGKPEPGNSKPLDPKELEQAAKDLNSDDPKKQQEARDKLDKAIGKENREQAEAKAKQLQQDLQSDDPKKREAAQKEIEKLQEQMKKAQAEQQKKESKDGKPEQGGDTPPAQTKPNGNGKPEQGDKPGDKKEPTPEQIAEAKKTLEDLNSKDDDTRQAAEKKVDDAVGKEAREQMQKDMKDLQSDDPKKQQEAKDRLEKQAKQQAEANKGKQPPTGPGAKPDTPGDRLKEDARNRLKSAELQLQSFEKAKADRELQQKLGYTPEQYEEFLKSYREMVERRREEVKAIEAKTGDTANGPTTVKVGEGAAKARDKKADAGTGPAAGGVGTAPPGYTEAQRKFAEEAAKLKKPAEKK